VTVKDNGVTGETMGQYLVLILPSCTVPSSTDDRPSNYT